MLKKKYDVVDATLEIHNDKIVFIKNDSFTASRNEIPFDYISEVVATAIPGIRSDAQIIVKKRNGIEKRVCTNGRATTIVNDINAALTEYRSKSKKRNVDKKVVAATTVVGAATLKAAGSKTAKKKSSTRCSSTRYNTVNSGRITTETYLKTYREGTTPAGSNNSRNLSKEKTGFVSSIKKSLKAIKEGEVKNYNSSNKK